MTIDKNYNSQDYKCLKLSGTPEYEVLDDKVGFVHQHAELADVKTLGLVLLELVTGVTILREISETYMSKDVTINSGQRGEIVGIIQQFLSPKYISTPLIDLLKKILDSSDDRHMNLEEIRNHEWMKTTPLPYKEMVDCILAQMD